MEYTHKPVLLDECIEMLNIRPGGVYVDGTLGRAGHSREIVRRLTGGRLICIDQDMAAIRAAEERLAPWRDRVTLVHGNFSDLADILREAGVSGVDGALFDLGVSSPQLDDASRGFSYMQDAPLDMRMDRRQTRTARDIINNCSEGELYRIIRDYGEERFAKNIAKHIVMRRAEKPIETTFELNDVIKGAIPAKMRQNGHPSKQTFQAIRIECNRELEVLRDSLEDLVALLNPGGRLCVITFHSLEDRIVKTAFRSFENPCVCPPDFPVCVCGRVSGGTVVTRKAILPSGEELAANNRSKSAKLRVFEKRMD